MDQKWIKVACVRADRTMASLAKELGFSLQRLSRIVRGRDSLTDEMRERVVKVLEGWKCGTK